MKLPMIATTTQPLRSLVVLLIATCTANLLDASLAWSQVSQVSKADSVKTLLSRHCYACHGSLKQSGNLRLDTVESMRVGGDGGPVIASDPASQSHLIVERITATDAALRMPPEGKPLTSDEIALVQAWIAEGARPPEKDDPQPDPRQHWSFKRLERPALPPPSERVAAEDDRSPIDRLVNAQLSAAHIQPLGQANKRDLLRRVTIDLIGLPPTIEEIRSFLADESEDAYEKVVERLLHRPEYGERWARHWMDVWRYSDWYGRRSVPDVMNSYPQIWRWRDWIVRSLQADKGYDRMVMEMLAADELTPDDDDNVVATGFIVRNWYKWNYETWMKDSVEHTGKAFLGLTLNCAMCHDHKFDPISQEDYFRFRAFFEPLELRHDRVQGEPDPGPFQKYVYAKSYGPISSGAIRVFDEKLDAKTYMFSGGDARNRIEGKPPVDAAPPYAFRSSDWQVKPVSLPVESFYPGLKEFVRNEEIAAANKALQDALKNRQQATNELALAEDQLRELEQRASAPPLATGQPAPNALLAAQRKMSGLRSAADVAQAAYAAASARLHALQRRIAADDAVYRKIGSSDELSKVAHVAENQANWLTAEHAKATAERQLILAEQALADLPENTADDKKQTATQAAQKNIDTARQSVQKAREHADSLRTKLNSIDTTYTPLSPKYPETSTGRRTALAQWIVAPENPLTARVAVNHIWLRHFGRPLVESVDNFGNQGKQPTHPELLDWLAVEFMSSGWSMKHLHRLIVTSGAYKRASYASDSTELENQRLASKSDRDNVLLWKYPTRRMEAEVVRDSILFAAGQLDQRPGGREIELTDWVKNTRRSMYFTQHGEAQMPFLNTFDGANVCDCYRRSSTVLPSQALALSNSELIVHASRLGTEVLARTAMNEFSRSTNLSGATSDDSFVQLAFERLLGRLPTAEELADSLQFLKEQEQALAGHEVDDRAATSAPAATSSTSDKTTAVKPTAEDVRPPSSDVAMRAKENF